jgi:hypothetical protein
MVVHETGAAMKATIAADTPKVVLPRWPLSSLIHV